MDDQAVTEPHPVIPVVPLQDLLWFQTFSRPVQHYEKGLARPLAVKPLYATAG